MIYFHLKNKDIIPIDCDIQTVQDTLSKAPPASINFLWFVDPQGKQLGVVLQEITWVEATA